MPEAAEAPAAVAAEPAESQDLRAWLARNSIGVTLIVGVILFVLIKFGVGGLVNAAVVGLGLSFIIFIHELGHFLVAKWCDVHVETFSIGFGPPLPGCRFQRGETTYMIAMVPLGGYVKMVGENPENDEDDTDPRSFKNKSVPQRMAIISAGVIMNLIFGCIAFIIVYMSHGVERQPGVIGQVEGASPAWIKGARPGEIIEKIGSKENPHFDQLRAQVVLSREGQELDFYLRWPGEPVRKTTIEPRRTEFEGRPVIGVVPPHALKLFPRRFIEEIKQPVVKDSAAADARPPFEFDDEIVGSSALDPASGVVSVQPLPKDPRRPGSDQLDYFELARRHQDLTGREMVIQVRRQKEDGSSAVIDISVPPAYHRVLGLRMQMGPIVGVQEGSPAAQAEVRANAVNAEGDRIKDVEVDTGKGTIRWVLSPGGKPVAGVEERLLDPMRLPAELAQVMRGLDKRQVKLTVIREGRHGENKTLVLDWNDAARYDHAAIGNLTSPVTIPQLGLAYQVQTTVQSVVPGSPASKAKKADGSTVALQADDVITAYRWFNPAKEEGQAPEEGKLVELKVTRGFLWWSKEEPIRDAWPFLFNMLQIQPVGKIGLRIDRGGSEFDVVLDAQRDQAWPLADRGIRTFSETRLETADSFGQAIQMGFSNTFNFVIMIYQQLEGLATNRISFPKNAMGPIGIFSTALSVADTDWYRFLLFLGMISVNLAVINFLPIPVLDGGHMVFLIYEWIRGKPAAEWVRLATTYAGLILIVGLMLYVIYLDVARLLS